MKKVAIISLVIITCFAISVFVVFVYRQRNPESIDFSTATALRSSQYPTVAVNAEGQININIATVDELCLISGIGPTLAGRIVEYRQTNGPYKSIVDLLNVRGIGEATLESIRPYICVE